MQINELTDFLIVKHLLHEEHMLQKDLSDALCKKVGKKTSAANFAVKIGKGRLLVRDLRNICDILGYDLILEKKK